MRLIDADALLMKLDMTGDLSAYDVIVCEEMVNEQPTIEAEPRWIPIEQDCPKMGKDVLISHNGVMNIDWLTQSEGVGYFFVSGVAVQDIDAWMSLPKPYEVTE